MIANDPDADRFCAAERSSESNWHIFTGNEMGIILAHHVFNEYKSQENFSLCTLLQSMANDSSLGHVVLSSFIKNVAVDG